MDDDRKHNAALFEDAFYAKKGIKEAEKKKDSEDAKQAAEQEETGGLDAETLAKPASSPELASLLKILAKNL
ncbi:MAG: hypothetical protein LUE14_13670 [Clostridiales bacterium]|nr:hypothetical protein [Clostridiales bacterium]